MEMIKGISNIIDQFDTFILDQWGVLHNGGKAFPAAIETLQLLKQHNKKVVILSNSGKTHSFSYARLNDSGIPREYYIDVLTSGDHMRHNFKTGKFNQLGKSAYFFTWDNETNVLDQCGVTQTNIEDASFVFCYGVDRDNIDDYMEDLKHALERNLELVVSNPDLVAMTPTGALKICPGAIAKAYQDMGGIVHWHGKPQNEIYTMCKKLVGGWNNAIAVGDSLAHDIAGANGAGISSLFITSGIHAKAITDKKSIQTLSDKFSVNPTYYVDWFKA